MVSLVAVDIDVVVVAYVDIVVAVAVVVVAVVVAADDRQEPVSYPQVLRLLVSFLEVVVDYGDDGRTQTSDPLQYPLPSLRLCVRQCMRVCVWVRAKTKLKQHTIREPGMESWGNLPRIDYERLT